MFWCWSITRITEVNFKLRAKLKLDHMQLLPCAGLTVWSFKYDQTSKMFIQVYQLLILKLDGIIYILSIHHTVFFLKNVVWQMDWSSIQLFVSDNRFSLSKCLPWFTAKLWQLSIPNIDQNGVFRKVLI